MLLAKLSITRSFFQHFLKKQPLPLISIIVTRRSKIWITKNQPPAEWEYGEQQDLMNVELANALDKLKPTDRNPPFLIVDLRENHERDLMDLPTRTKKGALIPRVNIPLHDLL